MASLPSPPFIVVPGISNFRDIGGHTTSDGQNVRRGLVFRAADPSKATEEGLKQLSGELGLKVIFDLRSAPEIKRDGPEWAGVEANDHGVFEPYSIHRAWVPVFAEEDYGPEQVALRYKEYTRAGSEGFVQAYRDIMLAGTSAYNRIFKHLAQPDTTPCLVNCTAGKDRTGVLIALLLLMLGVEAEKVAEEYALTDLGLAELKPLFTERLLKNPTLNGNREGVQRMVSAKKENMDAAILMFERDFGGAEAYVKKHCELGDEEVEQIRKNLLGT